MDKFTIERIWWDEGKLKMAFDADENSEVMLYSKKMDIEIPLSYTIGEDGLKYTDITFLDKDTRTIFGKGRWRFVEKETMFPAQLSDDIMLNIEDYVRCFYNEDQSMMVIVTPVIMNYKKKNYIDTDDDDEDENENDERIQGVAFEVSYTIKYDVGDYRKTFATAKREANSLKDYVRKCGFIVAKWIINQYYLFFDMIYKKNGKNILIMSENRNGIMDNLEAIDTRLKERGLDKEFNITYHFRNIFEGRQNPFSWLRTIRMIAKNDFIFVDDYAPIFAYIDMDERTTLVQVWHAGFGFKLVGYGRFGISGSPHPIKSCHRKYTYALIGNDYLREIYSEVFGIEREALLATGMPRLEHFLDTDKREQVTNEFYREFPELVGKRIITFAPTYRGSNQKNANYDFSQIDFDRLYDFCKKTNTVFIIKQHHFLREKAPISDDQKDVFYECSDHKLNDLFYVTDLLITDYSSCFYDFLLLGRPVLFFTYDRAMYSATRGVHRPIDKVAPGRVCDNFEQLIDALENEDYGTVEAADFLRDKCVTSDTLASDKVIDYVLLHKDVKDI